VIGNGKIDMVKNVIRIRFAEGRLKKINKINKYIYIHINIVGIYIHNTSIFWFARLREITPHWETSAAELLARFSLITPCNRHVVY
jgi:hypothetical protein